MTDKFNWDDYELAEEPKAEDKSSGTFDWDAYAIADAPQEEISTTGAFLRGAADMGTLGFRDEIVGGAKATFDKLTGQLGDKDFSEAYTQYRDEVRDASKQAQEESPWAYGGGALLGGVASSLGGGLAARGLIGAGKIGLGAMAAGEGAALGVGASEADLVNTDDLGGALYDTGKEAVVTGALSATGAKAMQGLGWGARKLADSGPLKKFGQGFTKGRQGKDLIGTTPKELHGAEVQNLADEIITKVPEARQAVGKNIGEFWGNPQNHILQDGKPIKTTFPEVATNIKGELDNWAVSPEFKGSIKQTLRKLNKPQDAKSVRDSILSLDSKIQGHEGPEKALLAKLRSELIDDAKTKLLVEDAIPTINTLNSKYGSIIEVEKLLDIGKTKSNVNTVKKLEPILYGSEMGSMRPGAQRAYMELVENLSKGDPDLAKAILPKLDDTISTGSLIKELSHDGHTVRDLGTLKAMGAGAGNVTGQGARQIPAPVIKAGATTVNVVKSIAKAPPNAVRAMATKAAPKYPNIAAALNEVADIPVTATVERASRLFSLHQLPEFRQFLTSQERKSK